MYFYMKVIIIIIPINLVTYTFLFSFRKNQKRESNFQQVGGLATRKISAL